MLSRTVDFDSPADAQLWRLLWSHAAQRIMTEIANDDARLDVITAGAGAGLLHRADPRRGLVVHPAGEGRQVGDLAITVLGAGTHVVPRNNLAYGEYLETVADIVAITARSCFAD